jgi:rRNA maturation endonuclease Nob1
MGDNTNPSTYWSPTTSYDPTPPYIYECMLCGRRRTAEHQPGYCANCGGAMQDISVARE